MALPDDFCRKMKQLLKNEADDFFSALRDEPIKGLRFNRLKIEKETFIRKIPFSLSSVPFCEDGFYYDEKQDEPGKHPFHAAGLYYIQEPSAMVPAEVLQAKPGEKILDLCAAPGGKSTQIAAAMENEGILFSNEIHFKRAKALSENIERFGIQNAIVINERPEKLVQHFPNYFDKILVDAPCSGEGMFRKDDNAIEFWSEDLVEKCSYTQKKLLSLAFQMLKPGGTLVYSTCTFSPEENEQVIEAFVSMHPEMSLVEIPKREGFDRGRVEWTKTNFEEISKCIRLWPHKIKGEGHFVAKLIKNGENNTRSSVSYLKSNVKKQQLAEFQQFEHSFLKKRITGAFFLKKQQLYVLPEKCPDITSLNVLRAGLHLGEIKKKRFEPNHHLALSLTPNDVKYSYSFSTNEKDWQAYLTGETISSPLGVDRGWILMTIDGESIGWGKETKGTIKNFYPKGLRVQF
ncbi:RsmF rRNA methyltransferase first C-terminal domain-containing protein [Aeribacillus composti]|jgi:NOL1/NOP2/sun family putative RNA methylase|uniref:RsmF rRNA methyltransferase first C-terminal domain-containing protein n=1 Tax=Aeribacillus composti TaxID=1868734 RepID=UPI003D25A9A9